MNRHVGDSLDKYPAHRDAFWALLEQWRVHACFVGHTHVYSTYRQEDGHVWQIDVGNAGNESSSHPDGYTFADVTVTETDVTYAVWRDPGKTNSWSLAESWSADAPIPGDADRDGDVDATDLATLGLNWSPSGTDKPWAAANFDWDGDVDATDLAALGLNWNPSGGHATPEPATLALVALAALAVLARHRT